MDQPLSPPLKLLTEQENVASPAMMLMLKLTNPLHTQIHTGPELALINIRLLRNHSTTQAVQEDGREEAQRIQTENLHVHMAEFPGSWQML